MKIPLIFILILFPFGVVFSQTSGTYSGGFKINSPVGPLYHRDSLILNEDNSFTLLSQNFKNKKDNQGLDGSEIKGFWTLTGDTLSLKPDNKNLGDIKFLIKRRRLYQLDNALKNKNWIKAKIKK